MLILDPRMDEIFFFFIEDPPFEDHKELIDGEADIEDVIGCVSAVSKGSRTPPVEEMSLKAIDFKRTEYNTGNVGSRRLRKLRFQNSSGTRSRERSLLLEI